MKREIIVFTILFALLGYLVYDSVREDESRMPDMMKAPEKGDVTPFSREDIARVELIRDGGIIVLEKERSGKFMLKSPMNDDVDRQVLEGFFSVFEKPDIKKTIHQDVEDVPLMMSEYGLEQPRTAVKFYDKKNKETVFFVGKESKENDGFFARWGDREGVLVLGKGQLPLVDVDAKGLRDKEIFCVDKRKLGAISYGDTRIMRKNNGWYMTAPLGMQCDDARVESFIQVVNDTRAVDFLKKGDIAVAWKQKGNSSPAIEFIQPEDKGKDLVISIVPDGEVKGHPGLIYLFKDNKCYIVKKDFLKGFSSDFRCFIDMRLLPFDREKVTKIGLSAGGRSFMFEKKDGGWGLAGSPNAKLDFGKVEDLVGRLTACADDLIPFSQDKAEKRGLVAPQYIIRVNDKPGIVLGTRVGKEVFFQREDSKNIVGKTSAGILECLSDSAGFFRDTNLLKIAPESVGKFSLARGGKEVVVEKSANEWLVTKPVKGKVAAGAVSRILKPLANLKAAGFVDNVAADLSNYGLDKPAVTMKVSHEGKEDVLDIGKEKSAYYYYASIDGVDGVFLLSRKVVKALDVSVLRSVYLVETDSNKDGVVDSWTYFDKGRKTKLELDTNNDGKPDSVSNFIYDKSGNLIKVETDNNNDGKPDQITYFSNKVILKEENDLDHNGVIDSWTYYKDGKPSRSEIDLNGDGKPDVTKYFFYNEKGELSGANVDENMDGKINYIERYEKGKIIREELPENREPKTQNREP